VGAMGKAALRVRTSGGKIFCRLVICLSISSSSGDSFYQNRINMLSHRRYQTCSLLAGNTVDIYGLLRRLSFTRKLVSPRNSLYDQSTLCDQKH
jgi:hypothetical protein